MSCAPDPVPQASIASESLELAELQARLVEAEATLDAIRRGEVDAVVVGGPDGQLVYTLENADRPYRVLIEQMQEGAVTLGDDGTILYCNQRFATLLGTDRSSVLGEAFARFLDPVESGHFGSLLALASRTGASAGFVLRAVAGTEVPVNVSLVDLRVDHGSPRVVCGVVTDLTQTLHRQRELAAANQRLGSEIDERRRAEDSLRLALDAAGMGIWDRDLDSGLARRSARHDQIFGQSPGADDWTWQGMLDCYVPEDRAFVARAFDEAWVTGALDFERRIARADDRSLRWLSVKGQTYYAAGRPVRIAGVVTDVTDRHEVEDQLRQAQKMEAVGQLTGGLAHDFNNLLTGISGSLELMKLRVARGRAEGVDRYLDAALGATRRAASLTHRLLAFSRRQTLDAKPTDVNRLIEGLEDLIRRTVGPQVEIEVSTSDGLWPTLVDPNQLESALLNLCINARDAMPSGGHIAIATSNAWLDERAARERELPAGPYLALRVSDTGSGMSAATIKRAFDPFFTTKPLGEGTGLGLSMVYGFARQSGGQVRIDSELGRGTTMWLYLPRHQGETPDAEDATGAVDAAPLNEGRTVLVVDDETTVREVISETLNDIGCTVLEADDGGSALRMLHSTRPIDLLITDVGLPGEVNGRQVADAARAARPGLQVLFITGYAETSMLGGVLGNGMEVMTKPFTLDDMTGRVRQMLSISDGRPG